MCSVRIAGYKQMDETKCGYKRNECKKKTAKPTGGLCLIRPKGRQRLVPSGTKYW